MNMRLRFAVAGGQDLWAGMLSLLVVVALLLCHGFFGGLHLASGSAHPGGSADVTPAGGHASHAGPSSDGQGKPHPSAPHHLLRGSSDYYAAVLVAAFGAALGLLLGSSLLGRWSHGGARRRGEVGLVSVAQVPVLARGPDRLALLQVFRL